MPLTVHNVARIPRSKRLQGFVELIVDGWANHLRALADLASEELTLCAPFITASELGAVTDRAVSRNVAVTLLTCVRPDSVLSGSLDVGALATLAQRSDRNRIYSVPSLHAKLYLADRRRLVLGSANLTSNAFYRNLEAGVWTEDDRLIARALQLSSDFQKLGSRLTAGSLGALSAKATELQSSYSAAIRDVRSAAAREFQSVKEQFLVHALTIEVAGRSPMAVFADAILFVLRDGPAATEEFHGRVRQLVPELCDDSTDRVING
ncbi:MAG: phospholipase D family protein, partial [Fimbriimonadales bacterium]